MNGPMIVRNIVRADQDIIGKLGEAGVATVHEAMGRKGLLGTDMRPIQRAARIAGSAVTVSSHPGDNLMIHAAVEVCKPGDILVVTTTSPSTDGMFGELLATSLRARGVIGLVIEAGVRDISELNAMSFPVWSTAVSAQGTVKASPGSVNVAIVCAGAAVAPGDVIVADDDGVACVPHDRAAWTLEQSLARIERETKTRSALASGELGLDIYGLRAKLEELGIRYVEGPDDVE